MYVFKKFWKDCISIVKITLSKLQFGKCFILQPVLNYSGMMDCKIQSMKAWHISFSILCAILYIWPVVIPSYRSNINFNLQKKLFIEKREMCLSCKTILPKYNLNAHTTDHCNKRWMWLSIRWHMEVRRSLVNISFLETNLSWTTFWLMSIILS